MSAKQAIKLVKVGDPLLKITCNKVIFPLSDQIDNTIDECINSLRNIEGFWEGKAISVSAPQVGSPYRMFVMCDRQFWYHPAFMYKKFMTVLNPEIIEASKETCLAWEGCISNDEHIALVERPKTIKVRFQTYNGKETDQICKGLMSRIFQHEIDHFDGVLMEELAKDLKSIDEFKSEEDFEKFRVEQKDRIIEY